MERPDELGIRYGYPHLPFRQKAKAYIASIRPFTLAAPLVGILATIAMAVAYGYHSPDWMVNNWPLLVHGTATLLLVQASSNLVNQGRDTEDLYNRPYRPVSQGKVSQEELLTLGLIGWMASLLRAATLNPAFGALILALVVTSYLYSSPPARLKSRTWIGNITVATARGLLGLPAAWAMHSPWNAVEPWTASGILFIYLIGATTCKDFPDKSGDKRCGVETLPVVYGNRVAALYSLPFVLAPVVLVPLVDWLGILDVTLIGMFLSSMCVGVLVQRMLQHTRSQNEVLEGGKPWAWMYYTMMALTLATTLPPGLFT